MAREVGVELAEARRELGESDPKRLHVLIVRPGVAGRDRAKPNSVAILPR
jgi:hypothetical protein